MGKKQEQWEAGEEHRQAILEDLAGDYAPSGRLVNLYITSWPEGLDRTAYTFFPPLLIPEDSYTAPRADIEIFFNMDPLPSLIPYVETGQLATAQWKRWRVLLVAESASGWVGAGNNEYVMREERLRERYPAYGIEWSQDAVYQAMYEYYGNPEGLTWQQIYAWGVSHGQEWQDKLYLRVPYGGDDVEYTLYVAPNFGELQDPPTLPVPQLYPQGDWFALDSRILSIPVTNPRPRQDLAPILRTLYGLDVPDPYGTLEIVRQANPSITPANNPWDVALPPAPGPIVPIYNSLGLSVDMAPWTDRGSHRCWAPYGECIPKYWLWYTGGNVWEDSNVRNSIPDELLVPPDTPPDNPPTPPNEPDPTEPDEPPDDPGITPPEWIQPIEGVDIPWKWIGIGAAALVVAIGAGYALKKRKK